MSKSLKGNIRPHFHGTNDQNHKGDLRVIGWCSNSYDGLLLVYVIAAQFIYSRRGNTSRFAETLDEEYGYADTEQGNYSISCHQLTGAEKGNYIKMT